jgi:hypothetical protein
MVADIWSPGQIIAPHGILAKDLRGPACVSLDGGWKFMPDNWSLGRIIRPYFARIIPLPPRLGGCILGGGINTPPLLLLQDARVVKNKTHFRATQIARYPLPTIQSLWSLENRRRRPRPTSSPKQHHFPPHLLGELMPSVSLETLGLDLAWWTCLCGVTT